MANKNYFLGTAGTKSTNMGLYQHVDFTFDGSQTTYQISDETRNFVMDIRGRHIISFAYTSDADVSYRGRVSFIEYTDLSEIDEDGTNFVNIAGGNIQLDEADDTNIINFDLSAFGGLPTAFLIQFRIRQLATTASVDGLVRAYAKHLS